MCDAVQACIRGSAVDLIVVVVELVPIHLACAVDACMCACMCVYKWASFKASERATAAGVPTCARVHACMCACAWFVAQIYVGARSFGWDARCPFCSVRACTCAPLNVHLAVLVLVAAESQLVGLLTPGTNLLGCQHYFGLNTLRCQHHFGLNTAANTTLVPTLPLRQY